ncbi:hypothetical protein [uncultured Winogradskyella sp.]|uniref:hypothetical protein n=1 Tax=uncultured Winogradskyella sp. TaxID=395353 RepID=UPI002622AB12|nr:hypothetical protein [uncultured Winogradskyella sp.]
MCLNSLKRNDRIGLFFFLAFVISSSLIWLFEERFNKEQWSNQPALRYKMVDDIIESQRFIKKSKDEVIYLLGQPTLKSNTEKDIFIYNIGKQPSFITSHKEHLLIVFKNEKVTEVTLATE